MFLLHSSEDAHAFFGEYRQPFMDAVELGIRDCDECHAHYTQNIVRDAVTHPATYRTHDIHYGPNNSLVLIFDDKANVRFQKLNPDFKFPTTNMTKREQDFRNPSATNLFGQLPLECVYAAYRLRSDGMLRDLYLMGMDQNEGKWTYNVGRGQGEDPLNIDFGQAPVAPVVTPDELARIRRNAS
jgi:hypothetical protein